MPGVNFKKLKPRPSGKSSRMHGLNMPFALALISVLFCWFFGLPGLVAAFFALQKLIPIHKTKKGGKGISAFKIKWGYFLAWSGLVLSLVFTVYYCIALVTGAFVRL